MTEEQFDKIELIPNHLHPTRGDQWETFGEEYEEVKKAAEENRVITALDVGGGMLFAMGWHYVNRIYYHITKHPLDKMPGLGDVSGDDYYERDERWLKLEGKLEGHEDIELTEDEYFDMQAERQIEIDGTTYRMTLKKEDEDQYTWKYTVYPFAPVGTWVKAVAYGTAEEL